MELSSEQVIQYDRDGFLIFPDLFSEEEVNILRQETNRISKIKSEMVVREGEEESVKIMFRMHEESGETASPAFRAAARTPRVLRAAQQCLHNDELYMHHSKLNMKAAIEGSVWMWHQDFHAWHLDGIAEPSMATMTVVLTEATALNGCMYVLPGSHKLGRSDPRRDESTSYKLWVAKTADMKKYMKQFPDPVAISGGMGTAAIFNCNLLHASGHNLSAEDRWQLFFCFNQCKNHPADVETPRPDYVRSRNWSPLTIGKDDGVISAGKNFI